MKNKYTKEERRLSLKLCRWSFIYMTVFIIGLLGGAIIPSNRLIMDGFSSGAVSVAERLKGYKEMLVCYVIPFAVMEVILLSVGVITFVLQWKEWFKPKYAEIVRKWPHPTRRSTHPATIILVFMFIAVVLIGPVKNVNPMEIHERIMADLEVIESENLQTEQSFRIGISSMFCLFLSLNQITEHYSGFCK